MGVIESFMAYAADFEITYADDDWSRLERHLADDCVYEVENISFACRIEGREAILAAIRKSLDGFDRRMDGRKIAVTRGPEADGDSLEADWEVTYSKAGAPDFVLKGSSLARLDGDRIVHLRDRYPDGMSEDAEAWIRKHAPEIDPSYL
jgi:hypothetical protein